MDNIEEQNTPSDKIKCQTFGTTELDLSANMALHDNSLENSIHLEDSFVIVHDNREEIIDKHIERLNERIVEVEKRNKKLQNDYETLEKRHGDLLKLMNEILKIKPSHHVDSLDNLEEIRQRITQILYNEVRRHTVFSFTPILGSYTTKCQSGTEKPNSLPSFQGGLNLPLHGNYLPIMKTNPLQYVTNGTNSIDRIPNTIDTNLNLNVD
jgi:hypothetical protein